MLELNRIFKEKNYSLGGSADYYYLYGVAAWNDIKILSHIVWVFSKRTSY